MTINLDASPSDYQIVDISPVIDEKTRIQGLLNTKITTESCLSKPLKFLDDKCDYIPILSTFTNVTDITLKACVMKNQLPHTSPFKSYVSHIQGKSVAACVIYAIPIIGNLFKIAVYSYENCRRNPSPSLKDIDYLNRYLDEIVMLENSSKHDDFISGAKVTI